MDYRCKKCGKVRDTFDDEGMLVIKACECRARPKSVEERTQEDTEEIARKQDSQR